MKITTPSFRYGTTPNKTYEVLDAFLSIGSLDYGTWYYRIKNDNGQYVDIPTLLCIKNEGGMEK